MDLALAASEQLREPDEREGVRLARTGAVGAMVVLTGAAAALGAAAETSEPTSSAVLRATMVAAPMAVGLYAGRVHMHERFGRLLYAMGLAAFVTTLAESSDDGLYTAGRVAGWGAEVLLVYLFLASPSGRLEARADRRLVAAAGGVFAFLLLPLAALARELPLPSQWTSCDAGDRCPANALFAVDHQPAFVDPALRVTAAIALFALAVAVATRLQHRISSGSPAVRRMLVPVLAVAMARAAVLGVAILTRELSDDAASAEGLAWLLALTIPALSLAFLVGLLQTRLLAEQALSRLARLVQGVPDAAALRRALGEALDDPTTQIAFPLMGRPGHFIDEHGDPLALPEGDATRSTFVVRDGTEVVAVVLNDARRTPPPQLRAAAAGIASVAIDNQRLIARGRAADVELRGSRARIAAAADAERRRLERDLHDGAQQRLVALRVELGLLEDVAEQHPELVADRVRALERSAEDALDELRALAHGVCPPLLTDRGLADSLRAAAQRCKTPLTVRTLHVGRYAPEVETAVYFCVLEALQNIDKHAPASLHAGIELDGRGPAELRFVIHDSGPGIAPEDIDLGSGMINMRDRIAAVGGQLRVATSPKLGTTVRGWVPTAHPVSPPARPPIVRAPATGPSAS